MTYRTPNLGGYYITDEVDFQHHPVPGFENQTLQIDSDGQNGYYHSSTELHRFAQNADRYTTNVRERTNLKFLNFPLLTNSVI